MDRKSMNICMVVLTCITAITLDSCKKEDHGMAEPIIDTLNPYIADDYSNIASLSNSSLWGSFNLHDPTIIKNDEYYYIFSTDVAYGPNLKCGIMSRRSKILCTGNFRAGFKINFLAEVPLLE